jgi:hypothetical protein
MSSAGKPNNITDVCFTVLLRVTLAILLIVCHPRASLPATSPDDLCRGVPPNNIMQAIAQRYEGWTMQSPASLSASAKARWKSEKSVACPALARGHFENSKKTSYAVLIVRAAGNQTSEAKLLLFASESSSNAEVLEDATTGGSDLFIRPTVVSRFFDKKSADRFGVLAPEAVLLFDASKSEYETDIYFRAVNGYRHEPVDY